MTDQKATDPHPDVQALVKKSRALVKAVSHDDNGSMVAGRWVGGNGGMLSRDTLTAAADELRLELEKFK